MIARRSLVVALFALIAFPHLVIGQVIEVSTIVPDLRVAPGEMLPIRTTLTDLAFAGHKDVVMTYRIEDNDGSVIESDSKTIGTAASGIVFHVFPLPSDVRAGRYMLEVEATYPGQQYPLLASIDFRVEPKYFGVFRTDLIVFSFLGVALCLAAIVSIVLIERRNIRRTNEQDDSHEAIEST